MRFAASPLMVAVALGLLAPSVLEVEEEAREDHASPDLVLLDGPDAEPSAPSAT